MFRISFNYSGAKDEGMESILNVYGDNYTRVEFIPGKALRRWRDTFTTMAVTTHHEGEPKCILETL